MATHFEPELTRVADLKPHKRNYRKHPADQIEHIIASINQHGFYRNVVVARDNTILAGHGVVEAVTKMGLAKIPVIRLDIDPDSTAALKVLTGDNGIGHLGEVDDRMFTEILKEIKEMDLDAGLLGTGYDDMMLANLLFVTRPESEIAHIDEAAEWIGMPEYEGIGRPLKMVVSFRCAGDRAKFLKKLGIEVRETTKSIWWPHRERDDISSVKIEASAK